MDKALKDAFLAVPDRVFDDTDIKNMELAEEAAFGDPGNWNVDVFKEVLECDPAKAIVARQVISQFRSDQAIERPNEQAIIPNFPPYLQKGTGTGKGAVIGYNPHDPSQYWVEPNSGKMYRWDGKRIEGPNDRWPYGEPRQVVIVKHTPVGDILVPDEQEMHNANVAEMDWYHHGYKCWIGKGGKAYGNVPREVRDALVVAQQQLRRQDGDRLILRPPRVA